MAWIALIIAGLLEVVWAVSLKHAGGFSRLWPAILVIASASASFVLLAAALRTLPVGTAYPVWVGIGAVGVTTAGIYFFSEAASAPRLAFIALIILGVIGLRALDPGS